MHLLLSGATGYLGRHLLARLLRDGHRVTALLRGGERTRLLAALAPFDLASPLLDDSRLQVVSADLADTPECLAPALRAVCAARPPAAFVHAAGLTRFEAHLADQLQAQNLVGTQHAWGLAAALGVPVFHHVSTAYVAGRATTSFGAADLACGQAFNNPYEASKYAAECWLRSVAPGSAMALTVQRPSIVVGGHPIGANHSVSTLYTFMKAVQFIRECCRRDADRGRHAFAKLGFRRAGEDFHIPVRVGAAPTSTVNLVAIDDVVDDLAAALVRPFAAGSVETRQITGHDYRIADIERAITTTLRLSGVRLVDATEFEAMPRNAIEAHFHRITQVYAPYLFGTPRFAPRPGARVVDPAVLTADYLRQAGERGRRPTRKPAPANLGALALGTLGINEPGDYFSALCNGAVGRHFLARHDYVDATVGFSLRGAMPCDITLRFDGGTAATLAEAEGATADCRYELDSALFMRIIHGDADLRAAFLAGKVRISGNTELALKFGALLGLYYSRIDDHLIAELSA